MKDYIHASWVYYWVFYTCFFLELLPEETGDVTSFMWQLSGDATTDWQWYLNVGQPPFLWTYSKRLWEWKEFSLKAQANHRLLIIRFSVLSCDMKYWKPAVSALLQNPGIIIACSKQTELLLLLLKDKTCIVFLLRITDLKEIDSDSKRKKVLQKFQTCYIYHPGISKSFPQTSDVSSLFMSVCMFPSL